MIIEIIKEMTYVRDRVTSGPLIYYRSMVRPGHRLPDIICAWPGVARPS